MKLFIFAILLVSIIGIDALNKAKDCKCRINTQNRIINGKLAANGSYPWYATIEFPIHERIVLLNCAATILSEDTLLTEGICLPWVKINGTNELLKKFRVVIKGSGQTVGIRDYIPHPNLNITRDYNVENDIGIVKLDRKITFSRFVQPACLNTQKIDQYSGELNVAGYGHQKSIFKLGQIPLHYDPAMKFDFSEARVFDRSGQLCPNEKNQKICVHSNDKQGICIGDQGSGLHMIRNGKTFVIGVNGLPFVENIGENLQEFCASGSSAARLSAYKQFIDQYAGDYCN